MISSNALSVFLLHHPHNGLGNENLRSVQEVKRASELAADSYKNVCKDFQNLDILTKSYTLGEIQLMFGNVAVENKSMRESVADFALAGNLGSPSAISFNLKIAFTTNREKIRLPIAEVLLCATSGNLTQSKKQCDWKSRNTVLLPPFLTENAILHSESNAGEILKIFARSIREWASDAAPPSEANKASDANSVVTIEAPEAKKPGKKKQASAEMDAAEAKKPGKANQASTETAAAETLASIADD